MYSYIYVYTDINEYIYKHIYVYSFGDRAGTCVLTRCCLKTLNCNMNNKVLLLSRNHLCQDYCESLNSAG